MTPESLRQLACCEGSTTTSAAHRLCRMFPRTVLGSTSPSRSGPTAQASGSSGPTFLGPGHLANSLAGLSSSLPMACLDGARTSSRTTLVGPEDLGAVGPGQVRRITVERPKNRHQLGPGGRVPDALQPPPRAETVRLSRRGGLWPVSGPAQPLAATFCQWSVSLW